MLAIAYPQISNILLNVDVEFTTEQVNAMNKFFEWWENDLNMQIEELRFENKELSDEVVELELEIDGEFIKTQYIDNKFINVEYVPTFCKVKVLK